MILCLDLSSTCTGTTLINPIDNSYKIGRINFPPKLSTLKKIHYLVGELKKHYEGVKELVIEDTYQGINPKITKLLDRIGGAVIVSWIDYSGDEPYLYSAVTARKLAGIDGRLSKAEIQLWVLERYFPKIDIKPFIIDKDKLRKDYVKGKITKNQWTYRLDKLSDEIAEATGINNDMSDSVILAVAHLKKVYNLNILKEA